MDSTQDISAPEAAMPSRRAAMFAGVAVAAAAAGAGVAWWQLRDQQGGLVDASLWGMSFDSPGGGQVSMAAYRGRPLVLNFWATWCPPCVEEMPMLDTFFRQHAANRWQLLGLAIDQPSAVRKFLAHRPVSYPVGLAGLEGSELSRSLGNSVGALPFTVAIDAAGQVRQRRMGRLTPQDLAGWQSWFG